MTELVRQLYCIAKTSGVPVDTKEKSLQPISGTSLRMRMMRSIQLRGEFGSLR
jgi:hypothetical protein